MKYLLPILLVCGQALACEKCDEIKKEIERKIETLSSGIYRESWTDHNAFYLNLMTNAQLSAYEEVLMLFN